MSVDVMTTRQRFAALMNFQPVDRLPLVEWAMWWDKTIERWHAEGLPGSLSDRNDITRHFGLDLYMQDWFSFVPRPLRVADDEHRGLCDSPQGYLSLRRKLFPRVLDDPARRAMWKQRAARQQRGEVVLWFTVEGFFWGPRVLLGIEPHLYAFYDQPQLMHQINSDLCDWMEQSIDDLLNICTPDFMTFAEDLSYNHGPMLSRELFNEFLTPCYRRVLPPLHKAGVLTIIDSDGDITEPAAWFAEVGLDGVLPLERQAGVEIAELRRRHPTMRFIGHFDKMTMTRGEAAMRAEFERLLPTAMTGGYIISVDHQTPPGVSYQQYQLFLRLFREYAARVSCGGAAQSSVEASREAASG
ncbi:MAG: hypothetical protein IT445_08985 [Phycisphaeraceae bacterium]|nr:hypothetical protein [Phycisphaeraceae bacterium]